MLQFLIPGLMGGITVAVPPPDIIVDDDSNNVVDDSDNQIVGD
jgi:hypothetical protein